MTDALLDPKTPPTSPSVDALIAPRAGLWHDIVRRVEAMGGRGEWVWGGPRYGWDWRARRASRPFITLTPRRGGFQTLVILGKFDAVTAAALPLGPRMRQTLETSRQFPDGRWLYHDIQEDRDVTDLVALLKLKLPPTMRHVIDERR
jgi:hypothetical protein